MIESSTKAASTGAIELAEERLQTLLPGIYRGRMNEISPVLMGLAPLVFDVEGNVEWDRMWGSFCDLAMAGGPPHKGKLLGPGTREDMDAKPETYFKVCEEIARGIALAARLQAIPSSEPGWMVVRCKSSTMANWMLRAITMENVSVRREDASVLLPVHSCFRLEKEIKNVITVTAKTTHYWTGHLIRLQQLAVANLFHQLESEAPLLQPEWSPCAFDRDKRRRVEQAIEESTGLAVSEHTYAGWIGLECGAIASAISSMRRLVANNILSRREHTTVFVPYNSAADPVGQRVAEAVSDLKPFIVPLARTGKVEQLLENIESTKVV